MKRIVIRRPGGYDRLELVEQADPDPSPGEVLIDKEPGGATGRGRILFRRSFRGAGESPRYWA